jgi:hypothetical protein
MPHDEEDPPNAEGRGNPVLRVSDYKGVVLVRTTPARP